MKEVVRNLLKKSASSEERDKIADKAYALVSDIRFLKEFCNRMGKSTNDFDVVPKFTGELQNVMTLAWHNYFEGYSGFNFEYAYVFIGFGKILEHINDEVCLLTDEDIRNVCQTFMYVFHVDMMKEVKAANASTRIWKAMANEN